MNQEFVDKKQDIFHISLSCMGALTITTSFMVFFRLVNGFIFGYDTMEVHFDDFITVMLILSTISIVILSFTFSSYRTALHNLREVAEN